MDALGRFAKHSSASSNSYASFMLSNLPRTSTTRCLHDARLPFLNYHFIKAVLNFVYCVFFYRYTYIFSDNRVGLNNSHIVGQNTGYLANLTNLLKPIVQSEQDWKLCWRASQDGWDSTQFHSLCVGKGPTITIVKVGRYIFGAYTSVSWGK